jgi:hypothetical protein
VEYTGTLLAGYSGNSLGSEAVCVDFNLDYIPGTQENEN